MPILIPWAHIRCDCGSKLPSLCFVTGRGDQVYQSLQVLHVFLQIFQRVCARRDVLEFESTKRGNVYEKACEQGLHWIGGNEVGGHCPFERRAKCFFVQNIVDCCVVWDSSRFLLQVLGIIWINSFTGRFCRRQSYVQVRSSRQVLMEWGRQEGEDARKIWNVLIREYGFWFSRAHWMLNMNPTNMILIIVKIHDAIQTHTCWVYNP